MKKIIPFLLFLPLVLSSIYLGFTQLKNKTNDTDIIVVPPSPTSATQTLNVTQTQTTTITVDIPNQINLLISSPESGITVDSPSISVRGTTGKNVNVVVNEQDLISNADGTFKTSVLLDEGENYIAVVAYDDFGNSAEREIMVIRTVVGL